MAGKSDGEMKFEDYENEEAHLPPTVTETNSKSGGFEGSDLFDEDYGNLSKEQNLMKNELRQRKMAKKNAKDEPNIFKRIKEVMDDEENATSSSKAMETISSLSEIIMYCLFLTLVTILTFSLFIRPQLDILQVMGDYFINDDYPDALNETSNFLDIQTVDDIWWYLENQLLKGIYWYENADCDDPIDKTLYNHNKYLGKVRLRMLKVSNRTCDSPTFFKRETRICIPSYSKVAEDKEPFGPENSSAFIHMDANALGTKDFTTHLSSITYGGGGFVQDLPLDNYEEALKIVQNLRKNKWIDSQITRILFIDFTTYNTQTKSYTAVKLYVEMKPLQMSSYHSITSVTVNEYDKFEDIIYLIYEGIFCSFTIFYFIQDLTELGRKGMSYFNDNWNLVDFVTLSLSVAYTTVTLQCIKFFFQNADDLLDKDSYLDISKFLDAFDKRCLVMSYLAAACWVKVFKYLGFTRGMVQLIESFYRSAKDLYCLNIILFTFIGSFATFAYITYAGHCESFITYFSSFFALLRTITGDVEYYVMKKSFPTITPIFFLSFVFVVLFIVLNMFLAVINDVFERVGKEDIPDKFILAEFFNDIRDWLFRLFKYAKDSEKTEETTNHQEMIIQLQKCGYRDYEIFESFEKFGIKEKDGINEEKQKLIENDLAKKMAQEKSEFEKELKQRSIVFENQISSINANIKNILQHFDTTPNTVKRIDDEFYNNKEL